MSEQDKTPTGPDSNESGLPEGEITDEQIAEFLEEVSDAAPVGSGADADSVSTEPSDTAEELTGADALAEERLQDLLRLQAEYQNYRKRVDRDREATAVGALGEVLRQLLPVLDDLDRVETHGDLIGGPLEVVAVKIRNTVEKMGLIRFGEVGEAFDPSLHEAIARLPNPEASAETVADVVEYGYRVGEKQLRPAKVAVQVPA